MATSAPSFASRFAIAAPMPRDAPVTSADLPLSAAIFVLPTLLSYFWRDRYVMSDCSASLRLLHVCPSARFGRAEHCLDDGHVGDCVFQRHGHFAAFENRLGEFVALDGVLIGGGEFLGHDAAAEDIAGLIDEEARGPVLGGVEGNLDLDAPLGAEIMHPLIGNHLGAAGEYRLPAGKIHHRRRQPIRSKPRIAL